MLELYDLEQRREVVFFGFKRLETEYVVRQISQFDINSAISYSRLLDASAEPAIEEEINFFSALDHRFEWKVFDYDEPCDLRARLAAHGFESEEPEALMVLDLASVPDIQWGVSNVDVRQIADAVQLADVKRVEEAVWKEDFTWLVKDLSLALVQDPAHLSVYVVYVDGKPVSSAWIRFHPNSQFASLWGGSTLPGFRGKGFYRSLVASRAREALSRNVRFLTVDASPMSQPVLDRLGFRLISYSHPCVWKSPGNPTDEGVTT